MNEHKLDVRELSPIDIHVTVNVAIWRQLGMWQDCKKKYTFVPTQPNGYVIITESGGAIGCKLLKGYALIRPIGLELAWDIDKPVVFRTISMIDAMSWRLCRPNASWEDVDRA